MTWLIRADAPPHPNQPIDHPDYPPGPGIAELFCDDCNQVCTALTCTARPVEYSDGAVLARVPYPLDSKFRCMDCHCAPGGYHHLGCFIERCPRCGGQMVACECRHRADAAPCTEAY